MSDGNGDFEVGIAGGFLMALIFFGFITAVLYIPTNYNIPIQETGKILCQEHNLSFNKWEYSNGSNPHIRFICKKPQEKLIDDTLVIGDESNG